MEKRQDPILLKSTAPGVTLAGTVWYPDGEPRAVVQIVHGMCEHLGRYTEFAEYLQGKGFAVIGTDLPGHGRTSPDEKDRGYFADKNGTEVLLKDMHRVLRYAKRLFPGKKVFLLGHSMGSFIVRRFMTLWGTELAGVIAVGTGWQPYLTTQIGKFTAWTMMKLRGPRYRSRLIYLLANGGYALRFKLMGKGSWLSKSENEDHTYRNDPDCGFVFTASGYHTLFALLQDLALQRDFARIPKDLPVLFASGMDDPVGQRSVGVLKAYNELVALNLHDLDLKLYRDDRHEILRETDRKDVWADLEAWLSDRI